MKTAIHNTPPKRDERGNKLGKQLDELAALINTVFGPKPARKDEPKPGEGFGARTMANGRRDRGFLLSDDDEPDTQPYSNTEGRTTTKKPTSGFRLPEGE